MFIKELLDNRGEVKSFTRPRRFGKTLWHQYAEIFLKMNAVPGKTEISFSEGLEIMEAGEEIPEAHGQVSGYQLVHENVKTAQF